MKEQQKLVSDEVISSCISSYIKDCEITLTDTIISLIQAHFVVVQALVSAVGKQKAQEIMDNLSADEKQLMQFTYEISRAVNEISVHVKGE